ncbi:MAG: hypothetical protein M3P23_06960 [Actinomycetota bacterium]|nr:hypothetical protein [Actinomycetota bacterium]
MAETVEHQTRMWLSLLTRLTAVAPDWLAMKGFDSALTGVGDVDSIAPLSTWPLVTEEFRTWAVSEGLGPVVICPHAPFLLHLVALSPLRPEFFELDINRRKIFLGSTLFRPSDVARLAQIDQYGIRRLRPGAEGVLKLIQNGATRAGHPKPEALRVKGVRELLLDDPEGVRQIAPLFGLGAKAVVRAAEAVAVGGWDRRAILTMEAACIARAPREPDAVLARIRFRWQRQRCPVLVTVLQRGRRVLDRERWLTEVAVNHTVLD